MEQLGGSIYSLQAHSAPAEDEARLLQGHEPARRLSEPDVRLSRLCVPAEGGDIARQSTRGRGPACSQSEGAESNQANDPAMVLASTERPDPGGLGPGVQPVSPRLGQLLQPLLQVGTPSNTPMRRCPPDPLGAEQVQTSAPTAKGRARLVGSGTPRKPSSVRTLARAERQRPNIGSRVNREGAP